MAHMILRGFALAIGFLLVVGGIAGLISERLGTTIWVVDLRWMPQVAAGVVTVVVGGVLSWGGWRGWVGMGTRTRAAVVVVAGLSAMVAGVDAVRFWVLLGRGSIGSSFPLPASMMLLILCGLVAWHAWRDAPGNGETGERPVRSRTRVVTAALTFVVSFPLVQMVCFGTTDYRRQADAVLVLGARAFADGTASDALEDRILTACDLIREGKAGTLILSGGPGDGAFHETDVMKRIALERGVREVQIVIDREGLSSRESIVNTVAIVRERGFQSVLAVSHFYHLPRLKLEAGRAGLALYTVPADQRGQVLKKLPYFMAREAAAWWWSCARGLAG